MDAPSSAVTIVRLREETEFIGGKKRERDNWELAQNQTTEPLRGDIPLAPSPGWGGESIGHSSSIFFLSSARTGSHCLV